MQKHTSTKRRNRLVAGLASIGLAVSAMVGVNLATATTAEAQTVNTWYDVNTWGVCQWQGHTGAGFYWQFNPYSWFCFDGSVSYPVSVGVNVAGGLNIEGWCQRYYGANARTVGGTVWDWQCYK